MMENFKKPVDNLTANSKLEKELELSLANEKNF